MCRALADSSECFLCSFLTSFTFKIAVTKEANRNQKQDKTIKRIAGLATTKIGDKKYVWTTQIY
jgi:hypothetical protein